MSRKYVNERCVRCNKKDPTPYLRKKLDTVAPNIDDRTNMIVADIGCGNGRNSEYMKEQGFEHVYSYDMAGDKGDQIVLGHDSFPLGMSSVDIVLVNYILMFLDVWETLFLLNEIDRIVKPGGYVMVELYGAKDSYYPTKEKLQSLQEDVESLLEIRGWETVHSVKEKFIMRKN